MAGDGPVAAPEAEPANAGVKKGEEAIRSRFSTKNGGLVHSRLRQAAGSLARGLPRMTLSHTVSGPSVGMADQERRFRGRVPPAPRRNPARANLARRR
jgi:hypothetical protein